MMPIGAQQHLLQVFRIAIHTAGDEGSIRAQRQRQRIERMIYAAGRRGFGYLVYLRGWRILAFCKTIYLVIEQQNINVEIAAQQVNGMVSPNAEPIAIACNDPDAKFGAGGFKAGGYSSGATMNRVHTIRIHIVWKAGTAANAGNDHNILPRDARLRQNGLHLL